MLTEKSCTSGSTTIQDLSYTYDVKGLLASQADDVNLLYESYTYDNLNRLTTAFNTYGSSILTGFDNMGNITSKTDIGSGTINYGENGAGPHAISSIESPSASISIETQDIDYTVFNKVAEITETVENVDHRLEFFYGTGNERKLSKLYQDEVLVEQKLYSGGYEKITEGANIRELHYINSPDGMIAIFEVLNGTTENMYYIHTDRLGSINVVTNETDSVLERYAFDAWGNRRNPNNWTYVEDYQYDPDNYLFDRGFTGHEHHDEFALINMNGRFYDPVLGRMLSPDNFIQSPGFSQSFNRFSYCWNDPINKVDPSGEFTALAQVAFIDVIANGGINPFVSKEVRSKAWTKLDPTLMGTIPNNHFRLIGGLFNTNEYDDNSAFEELFLRFTWGLHTTLTAFGVATVENLLGQVENVYYGDNDLGATIIDVRNSKNVFSLSPYLFLEQGGKTQDDVLTYMHEYGHYVQAQYLGPFYLSLVGCPSMYNKEFLGGSRHDDLWFETWANIESSTRLNKYFNENWEFTDFNGDLCVVNTGSDEFKNGEWKVSHSRINENGDIISGNNHVSYSTTYSFKAVDIINHIILPVIF